MLERRAPAWSDDTHLRAATRAARVGAPAADVRGALRLFFQSGEAPCELAERDEEARAVHRRAQNHDVIGSHLGTVRPHHCHMVATPFLVDEQLRLAMLRQSCLSGKRG